MPEYRGQIINNGLRFTKPGLLPKWLEKHNGSYFKAKLSLVGKADDPKTAEQLGFYFAVLLPAVYEELEAQGYSIPVALYGFKTDIPITEDATHEILTGLCGLVGDNGKHLRVSEMDKFQLSKYINNVLHFAVVDLGMNSANLEAWKPKR